MLVRDQPLTYLEDVRNLPVMIERAKALLPFSDLTIVGIDQVLEKNLDKVTEAFFYVLRSNVEEAQRQNQEQAVQALGMIGNMAMAMLQTKQGASSVAEAEIEANQQTHQPDPQSEILISKR